MSSGRYLLANLAVVPALSAGCLQSVLSGADTGFESSETGDGSDASTTPPPSLHTPNSTATAEAASPTASADATSGTPPTASADATPTATPTETPTPTPTHASTTAAEPADDRSTLRREGFAFRTLPYDEWPQSSAYAKYTPSEAADLDPLVTHRRAERTGVHVVQTARQLLCLTASYRKYGDDLLREKAVKTAEALLETAVRRGDALFFPYGFPYHTQSHSYDAPWFSGMAQGLALSAYVRLYHQSGDDRYLDVADGVFASLAQLRDGVGPVEGGLDPWVVAERGGYYWIEEYPSDPLNHTLNGMNFAIWALYEYWRTTGNETSRHLLGAAATTIHDNVYRYRREGRISYYCLEHRSLSEKYHGIHVGQLKQLHRLTGDETFAEAAADFESDASP